MQNSTGKHRKRVILLGLVNRGRVPLDGESAKNQQILSRLQSLGWDVIVLDFYKWKRRPWVLVKTLASLVLNPRTPVILSSSAPNVYPLMRAHKLLHSRRKMLHWVIGGTFADRTRAGMFDTAVLKTLTAHFVESPKMCADLKGLGLDNVRVVPNFKNVVYLPKGDKEGTKMNFVFVSRIIPEKGADYVLGSTAALDAEGLAERFTVTFYGGIDSDYKGTFESALQKLPNASYGGSLDFRTHAGYDRLARYDAMLFPTYWHGEGFAGIFLDSFIAGVPMIVSDWAHNRAILEHTGAAEIVPAHDQDALTAAMRRCITGETDLAAMAARCQQVAPEYDTARVITQELMAILE